MSGDERPNSKGVGVKGAGSKGAGLTTAPDVSECYCWWRSGTSAWRKYKVAVLSRSPSGTMVDVQYSDRSIESSVEVTAALTHTPQLTPLGTLLRHAAAPGEST